MQFVLYVLQSQKTLRLNHSRRGNGDLLAG
jgi:hypothetical protein